jgi:tripartite-type tricarboxylate transporter receptor subunit TctC
MSLRLPVAVLVSLLPGAAFAQAWPAKPIQVISSSSIGSSGDVALRLVTAKMASSFGQPVTVDFRGGAGGALAATPVMRAAPDGYTMLYGTTGSFVFARYLMKNLPFDILKDFAPVSLSQRAGTVLTVHASVPVNSFPELIEYSKRNPGKLSYGSSGNGSIFHLIGETLKVQTGMSMVHVPYSQANYAQLINDWGTGRVEVFFPDYLAYRATASKVKTFAVIDSARMAQLPNVPQINELLPKFETVVTWWGYFGPTGLPRPIAERFAAEVKRSLQEPDVTAKLDDLGLTLVGSTPDELANTLRTDLDNTARIVKLLGIQPQ